MKLLYEKYLLHTGTVTKKKKKKSEKNIRLWPSLWLLTLFLSCLFPSYRSMMRWSSYLFHINKNIYHHHNYRQISIHEWYMFRWFKILKFRCSIISMIRMIVVMVPQSGCWGLVIPLLSVIINIKLICDKLIPVFFIFCFAFFRTK